MGKEYNLLLVGWVIGMIMASVTALFSFGGDVKITTTKKIIPDWKLVTDGKKVDTLYIYKNK